MYFASFGEEVLNAISSFASQASSALIDEIRIPLLTCLTIYFLIKGYLITYGRIDSPLSDFVLTAGKILLVTYFGLNALNYVNEVIPAIRGLENMLVGILRLPGAGNVDTQGAWTAIDDMWKQLMLVTNVALSTAGKVSIVSAFGTWLSLFFLGLLMAAISVALTFAATGVLIINEISLTLALAFGPLFICCLMFPAVRSWFDGWIKAVVTYVFCSVLVAAVILLVTNIFQSFATDLLNSLRSYESGRPLISVWLPVLKFSVLGLALTSLVKLIPSIAAAIVGGVALQAAGLGQMMNDTWRGARDLTGGFVNGLGKGSGSTDLQNYSRSHLMSRDGFGEHGTVGAAAFGAALGGTYRLGRTLLSVMQNEAATQSMAPDPHNATTTASSRTTATNHDAAVRTNSTTAQAKTAAVADGVSASAGATASSGSSTPTFTRQETPEETLARMNAAAASRQSERVAQFAAQDAAFRAEQHASNSATTTASQAATPTANFAGQPQEPAFTQAGHSASAPLTERLAAGTPATTTSPTSEITASQESPVERIQPPNENVARTNADILRDRLSKS